jgi:GNAT superfamily N-acetyltransferase
MSVRFVVQPLDFETPGHAESFLALLDHYASDPMGGGSGLSAYARRELIDALRVVATFHGALAFVEGGAVGLINCFLGFSTFAARPLLNVHDLVVRDGWRGQGAGQVLLDWAEGRARDLGCCRLTLEVLSNNHRAMNSYRRAGYVPYVLDSAAGQALVLQKNL